MKTNRTPNSLPKNQSIGHQPVLASCHSEIGQGASQPPRKSVVINADTVTMLMYSARKNRANFSDVYSVWKPPTNSPSASGRSKGARFVSPTIETAYTANATNALKMNQWCACASTMSEVDSEPD